MKLFFINKVKLIEHKHCCHGMYYFKLMYCDFTVVYLGYAFFILKRN